LEVAGIVERRVYAETPVRVEYQLTDKGRALQHVFSAIGEWAYQWNICPGASAKETDAA
jgi:DNA-binding HxlR family transcriptional regulator